MEKKQKTLEEAIKEYEELDKKCDEVLSRIKKRKSRAVGEKKIKNG